MALTYVSMGTERLGKRFVQDFEPKLRTNVGTVPTLRLEDIWLLGILGSRNLTLES